MIYQDFVKFLITSERNLNCPEVLGSRGPSRDVPSWATDWRSDAFHCSVEAYTIPRVFLDSLPHRFPPKFPDECEEPYREEEWTPLQYPETENELHVKGFRLGIIQKSQTVTLAPQAWRFDN